MLLMTTGNEHLAIAHGNGESLIVGVHGCQEMPLSIMVIFRCRRGYETCGVAANHQWFAASKDGGVATARHVQVGQVFCFNVYFRVCRNSINSFCRKGWQKG